MGPWATSVKGRHETSHSAKYLGTFPDASIDIEGSYFSTNSLGLGCASRTYILYKKHLFFWCYFNVRPPLVEVEPFHGS